MSWLDDELNGTKSKSSWLDDETNKGSWLDEELSKAKSSASQADNVPKTDARAMYSKRMNEENLKKAAIPVNGFSVAVNKPDIRNISDIRHTFNPISSDALKGNAVQFASGIAESSIPRAIMSMQKLSSGREPIAAQGVKASKPYANAARIAGNVAGEVAGNALTYGIAGKAISGAKALQKIGSPFLRNVVAGQLADTAIQTPVIVAEGVANNQNAGQILGNIGKQQAMDLAGNVAFAGAEPLIKGIANKLKTGKSLTKGEVAAVSSVAEKAGGNTNESVEDQVKRLDEYFQSRRSQPSAPENNAPRIYGDTPKGAIPEGMKERGLGYNIRTDSAMPDDIRVNFDENPLAYKQISNNETLKKAQTIFDHGEEAATAELYRSLGNKEFKPESVPLSKLLAKQAIENGNIEKARQVLSETANRLTEAGQFSQAAKILREADPETFLYTVQKQLKKLNDQGLKQYGKKWTAIDLLQDEITAIQNIPVGNQQAYDEVWDTIGNRIAKDLPSTGMEKFDAWRRIAMLLNPKTHIRNTIGNALMSVMRKSSDTLGAGLEKVFRVKERTKSLGWSFNKDLASKVDDTWNVVKKNVLGESRWEIDNLQALGRERRIFGKGLPTKAVEKITGKQFDRGALQWVNELSLKSLNLEDNIFAKRAFKDSLGQYMQANKLSEATDTAIEYAKRRALEATFKQANMLSNFITKAKSKPVIGKLVEGAIPFSKTPSNIAARAAEYSPIGLIRLLSSNGKTPAEVIETLSKGLTGSAITALGFYLGASGWAKVERNRSDKAEGIMQESGDQPNSLITKIGSYTFDFAQPFAVPLAMGVAASESIKSRKDGDSITQAVWDGVMAGGDTIFNMTMMQNIKKIFSGGSITEKIAWIPVSYVEQSLPSMLGQVARTVDPVKRSTYDSNPIKQEWNRVKSKIPFVSKTLQPALNVWGEEQGQGGLVQQFINPGQAKKRSDDPVTNEVARLYKATNDNDMLPKMAQNFTVKGETVTLSPETITQFQRDMGHMNYQDVKGLINSPRYNSLSDEQKAKRIGGIVSKNYEEVKEDIIIKSALKSTK